jgi:glycosyltransferase involved in cell wall biosynthesis
MLPLLVDQAVHMGISDKVVFTGALTDEEVKHIHRTASVYVMPSVSEPFGITALEAISAGTPTIMSKNAGASEAFRNCLKVDFWDIDEMANKIISLLRYTPLHTALADRGKREIELFTWDRVADRTLDVYRGVT